jgi:hypothetical protein
MNGNRSQSSMARRSFLARLGIGATAAGATIVASTPLVADVASNAPWRPARHAQDDWFDRIPGEHRLVFDTTTADGMALALRFANNYFAANRSAYDLKTDDLAVVIVARHKSTSFCYSDAMWAKYGKQFSQHAEFTDPKTKAPPTTNVYAKVPEGSDQASPIDMLIKKGVQFAVCEMSTLGIASIISEATGAKTDSVVKELARTLSLTRVWFLLELWR